MRLIGAGVRVLARAITDGDPLVPAVTIFLASIAIAFVVAAVRYSRR
ncbi:hypothetical protein [Streptomyces sp. NRRL WC-3742]|nr:hypothetical protein [Streptomyces sp. NRRL WC-3742]